MFKVFPHSAIAQTRPPRSADASLMSRSLNPLYDGLAHGLGGSGGARTIRDVLSSSQHDQTHLMSRSFAGEFK